jgi:hypothetical protein
LFYSRTLDRPYPFIKPYCYMKHPLLSLARGIVLCAGIMTLFHGCKKSLSSAPLADRVQQARDWFEQSVQKPPNAAPGLTNNPAANPRFAGPREPLWDQARAMPGNLPGALIIPVHYQRPLILGSNTGGPLIYAIDNIVHLLVYKDSADAFHAELVTAFPDSVFDGSKAGAFSGLVLVESWQGTPIERIKSDGHTILVSQPDIEPNTVAAGFAGNDPCGIIYGYNYAVDDPENGVSWQEGEGCPPDFALPGLSSQIGRVAQTYLAIGGGGGTPPSPAANFRIISGESPIANIIDYNKCFTNAPGTDHTYQVAVCVDQPTPRTRDPWGVSGLGLGGSSAGSNPVDVGHTFLVMTEITPFGTICRNVGFFPTGIVTPLNPSSPGQLNNNQNHGFNISLTINVTNSQFFQVLDYIDQGNNFIYDLNSNNCTTFALSALRDAGIDLPATDGIWPRGGGNDPGDLGEDIRDMSLSPNMSVSTANNGHPNQGTCN